VAGIKEEQRLITFACAHLTQDITQWNSTSFQISQLSVVDGNPTFSVDSETVSGEEKGNAIAFCNVTQKRFKPGLESLVSRRSAQQEDTVLGVCAQDMPSFDELLRVIFRV
jgi:hypothetical protein